MSPDPHTTDPATRLPENRRSRSAKRALIIDDDPLVRNLLDTLLRRIGFVCSQAGGGEEAILLLDDSRSDSGDQVEFDLIIIDLMMPAKNGWDVVSHIESRYQPSLRNVLIVTAVPDNELGALKNKPIGAPLRKPVDTELFYATVAERTRGPFDPDSTAH